MENTGRLDVLLVEDDPDTAELMRLAALSCKGRIDFVAVDDGEKAVEYVWRSERRKGPRPDLILLDLNLPKLGGLGVLERIKRAECSRVIPVLVLSSSVSPGDIWRAYRLGAAAYLVKPLQQESLCRMIRLIDEFWLGFARIPPLARHVLESGGFPGGVMDLLRLVPLDKRRLQDFEHLMSGKEFGGCYCARWDCPSAEWKERCKNQPHQNLERTSERVRGGGQIGFLVLRDMDGAVVGWTGAGPKTAFAALKDAVGSRSGSWHDAVWTVGCLAVGMSYRGQGYAKQIVELVVEEARRAGARSIEAYPLEAPDDENAYRGDRKLYESLGFTLASREAAEGGPAVLRMEKPLAG